MFQVQRCLPKALILDVFMPRLGGIGALQHFRKLDPEIVVILMSGDADALETVTEAGVNLAGVFRKPVDPGTILEALAQAGVLPGHGSPPEMALAPF